MVSGRLTQTGFPYVANDPHRVLTAPSLRYFVHLVAPGWNVTGGEEPVLPGVSIGHNEYSAGGLTVFGQDNEDLYVYETNPEDPNQHRYLGGWEDMRSSARRSRSRASRPRRSSRSTPDTAPSFTGTRGTTRPTRSAPRAKLDVGPAARGGYDSTLNNTGRGDNQTSGASFRVILDVANWDNSVATSSPG